MQVPPQKEELIFVIWNQFRSLILRYSNEPKPGDWAANSPSLGIELITWKKGKLREYNFHDITKGVTEGMNNIWQVIPVVITNAIW